MTTVSAPSKASCISDYLRYTEEYATTREGVQKSAMLFGYGIDWAEKFSGSLPAGLLRARGQSESLSGCLSLWELMEGLSGYLSKLFKGRPSFEDHRDGILGAACSGADSALFLEGKGWFDLGSQRSSIQGIFWGSLFLLSSIDLLDQLKKSEECRGECEKAVTSEKVRHFQRREQLANLKLLKDISSVAAASIALLSLVFGCLAQGVYLFPTLFLGCCSLYVVLSILSFYAEKRVDDLDERAAIKA